MDEVASCGSSTNAATTLQAEHKGSSSNVRKFYVGDEICRLLPEGPILGELVERTLQNLFVVKWRPTPNTTEIQEGFNPYELKQVDVINRKLQVGENVLVGSLGQKGRVSKVLESVSLLIPKTNRVILNASLADVHPFMDVYVGEPIYYEGWFGQIETIEWWVILEFGSQFRGGISVTTNAHSGLLKTYHSALPEIQDKVIPPHKGQTFYSSEIDLHRINWITTGLLFPILGNAALSSRAVVADVQVASVSVKWSIPLAAATLATPPSLLTGTELENAVALDHFKRNWLAMNTVSSYTIQQENEILNFRSLRPRFIDEHFGNTITSAGAPKRRKTDSDAVKPEIAGESVEVVVHSLRQKAEVVLENGTVEEYFSSTILQRDDFIAENNIPVLEYVQRNKFEGLRDTTNGFSFLEFSLVLSKNMSSEIFVVRKFTSGSWETVPIAIGPDVEMSKYDVVPHERYGNLRKGEIVIRSPHHPNLNFQVGVIKEITESGRLEIFCGESHRIRPLWPFEVEHFGNTHWKWKFLPTQIPRPGLPFHIKNHELPVSEKHVVPKSSTTFTSALIRWNNAITAGINAVTSIGEPADAAPTSESQETPATLEPEAGENTGASSAEPPPPSYLVVQNYFQDSNEYGTKVARDIEQLGAEKRPPGIALKKDPLRFDLWTALMQGPSGTPYEDGLFIFDILLDVTYPHNPPKIHFRPPSLAKISPNLKRDGTVCLSLLNNWPGAMQWDSQWSLVDFLVRVRDAVFVAEPYYNKRKLFDNREALLNKNTYCNNARIYNTNVCVAVLDSLLILRKRPPHLWRKEITNYVRHRALKINTRLRKLLAVPADNTGNFEEVFHILPLSAGLRQALPRRIEAFEEESDDYNLASYLYAIEIHSLSDSIGFEPLP